VHLPTPPHLSTPLLPTPFSYAPTPFSRRAHPHKVGGGGRRKALKFTMVCGKPNGTQDALHMEKTTHIVSITVGLQQGRHLCIPKVQGPRGPQTAPHTIRRWSADVTWHLGLATSSRVAHTHRNCLWGNCFSTIFRCSTNRLRAYPVGWGGWGGTQHNIDAPSPKKTFPDSASPSQRPGHTSLFARLLFSTGPSKRSLRKYKLQLR